MQRQKLVVYNISDPENPELRKTVSLSPGVETIFSTDNHLFIGTNTGVLIYGISNPENPVFTSVYQHVTSCDPVVVEGKNAFLTLRGGTDCRQNTINTLEVLDVSNITYPRRINEIPLTSPYGLGIGGDYLNGMYVFVCDGPTGLKVFEVDNQKGIKLNQVNSVPEYTCFDLITQGKRIIVTGPEGIKQYDFSNILDLKVLSTIPVVK
jgi:hypothetical protein